jgi:D-glycero-alpha-D-manno-heptose-7-phosphate kinase
MILARSPLRVSLGGGGTDLPSYYREHGGLVLAAAIDKYVYVALNRTLVPELIVKYSQTERVASAAEVRHPIVREALALLGLPGPYLELASMADIPAGTGLGSSGSFATALLAALHAHCERPAAARELAEQACQIEIERLGEPIGKQDPYIAAHGGLASLTFGPGERVDVAPLQLGAATLGRLREDLLLFYSGRSRSAGEILKEQDERTRRADPAMTTSLHHVKHLGLESQRALERGDMRGFAEIMNEHWRLKRERSRAISTPEIDAWHELGMRSGALAGKLVGAGGGGFLLFYAGDAGRLRRAMAEAGLPEVRFGFDFEGTRVLVR